MNAAATPPQGLSKPPSPEQGSQSGYENMPITKVPGWDGIIAWGALLNGLATGLFLAAAISELAAPAVFMRVAKVAYPVALFLLLVDLGLLVLDLGDPLRFHHMLRVFKIGSPLSGGAWWLALFSLPLTGGGRLRGLQGRAAQHERATGLERRALARRLSHQFGPPDGLRGVPYPVRPDGTNAGGRHPPHRLCRAARAQCDSLSVIVCEPSA